MAQEEETQKSSNSNGGGGGGVNIGNYIGRSSKKQKQKKVPQRGLGVAQLEKIRLEEQQKKDGSIILLSPPPISPTTKHSNSNLSMPLQKYSAFSSSIPYHSDISLSPNSIIRPQYTDNGNSNTVPLANSVGWQSGSVHQGHGHVPKMWNSCDYNVEKDSCVVDNGLAFRSSVNLPYESKPNWPLPSLMQRSQQYQQPSSSPSLMVNVSSANSSSLLKFQIEPPSNQSCYSNCTPVWPEDEKMVGMKRPYPFSLDNPPGQSFHYNKYPLIVNPISRSDESASFGNGSTFNFNPGNPNFREGPSNPTSILEPNSKKSTKENGVSSGDFLTLAPPTILTCSTSKFKRSSSYLPFDFDSLPYQGNIEEPILQPGSSVPNQQEPYYSFLPPNIMQTGQATKTINNCNGGEVGETVDLNLKL